MAVLFMELCEKYLCTQLLLFKNVGENNLEFKAETKNIKIPFKGQNQSFEGSSTAREALFSFENAAS